MSYVLPEGGRVAVVGLGYIGLPLAVAFGGVREVIGFDIDTTRVTELQSGYDKTRECSKEQIQAAKGDLSPNLHPIFQ